ncbi:glycosyltransferase family 2 protein [Catalinimonas niigatensis]|uniref:glycosyltransferase family 2 protein n=1 Tax=Catalinimonas niigatensis TaxID=1397264 RepID=UPI0026660A97|nr:glycosyltransferase family 2 protein [Catalinimonas niigatensis]WPP52544.1 glycosyltransferase family 2 protein [Catalinimonas niigatensis]
MDNKAVKISAVIITFNEEKNIGRCIDSLQEVADEVVVVDSFSTDKTKEICLQKGAVFIEHAFEGHIEQKNYALTQATYDHVLSLDADEALSPELLTSILATKKNWIHDGYKFNRLTNYCGRWIKHCGWYPDTKLRLWDRRKGQWEGINPHDSFKMIPDSVIRHIKGDLLHYSYYTIEQHVMQTNKFSSLLAEEYKRKGKKVYILIHFLLYPAFIFFKRYILQFGFRDGMEGFIICKNTAYYKFLKYAKLREMKKQQFDTL